MGIYYQGTQIANFADWGDLCRELLSLGIDAPAIRETDSGGLGEHPLTAEGNVWEPARADLLAELRAAHPLVSAAGREIIDAALLALGAPLPPAAR